MGEIWHTAAVGLGKLCIKILRPCVKRCARDTSIFAYSGPPDQTVTSARALSSVSSLPKLSDSDVSHQSRKFCLAVKLGIEWQVFLETV